MAAVVELLDDEQQPLLALVVEEDGRRIAVSDERGRVVRLTPERVLFRHDAESIAALRARLDALQAQVDVSLLWESVVGEGSAHEAAELARRYFDDDSAACCSAIYRALSAERLHFRRRGRLFEARPAENLAQVCLQQRALQRAAAETQRLEAALRGTALDDELAARLERWLRGAEDRPLLCALEAISGRPAELAFQRLLDDGRLPPTADLEVLQANVHREHPPAVVAYAEAMSAPPPGVARRSAFSIDDPETREVDDALTVSRDGELLRVDVDIADAAAHVAAGDPVDREAARRATTVYLPTMTAYMLPEAIGCRLGSLRVGEPRPTVRTSVWLDEQGEVRRSELARVTACVERRLDYEQADALLEGGDDPTAADLRSLRRVAEQLAARRRERGAISFRRAEWKIRVSPDGRQIAVQRVPSESASRALVAEMMILVNGLAAQHATRARLPFIYRTQPPPTERPQIDLADPALALKLRRSMQPATLSLHPTQHWGLGLDAYAQVSSPLRRYADLVAQRQLCAALAGDPLPYTVEELLTVLATAEATERDVKRLESAVTARWALEAVARLEERRGLEGEVVGEAGGGHRVELACCGAQGILVDGREHALGERLRVDVQSVKPRAGVLRLRPA